MRPGDRLGLGLRLGLRLGRNGRGRGGGAPPPATAPPTAAPAARGSAAAAAAAAAGPAGGALASAACGAASPDAGGAGAAPPPPSQPRLELLDAEHERLSDWSAWGWVAFSSATSSWMRGSEPSLTAASAAASRSIGAQQLALREPLGLGRPAGRCARR